MTQYALYLNYEFCTGCHSCEVACRNEKKIPLGDFGMKLLEDRPRQHADGSWHWDYIAYPTELCDLCADRVAEGKMPSCVQMCQAKCLHFGTIEECAAMLAEKGEKAAIFLP
ncbi:MAG: oxidoreductase [Eggerthellaceae bacterium]|nr:oxidoreductase [Eggerthellaceae bacterium]